jgi:hypothetical protein
LEKISKNSQVVLRVDKTIYFDVVRHYYADLDRMSNKSMPSKNNTPNDCKQKAIYAFWIRKLKPISLKKSNATNNHYICSSLNEYCAIHIVISELDIIYDTDALNDISKELWHDLLYFFRYKSVSPHALYLILAFIYTK